MNEMTYLAIGDSYTIGEAVAQEDSFPYQLVKQLKADGIDLQAPAIIAKTGWTTSELQAAIRAAALKQKFDIVTLLIGVNNQYRGESKEAYRKEFRALLQTAIGFTADNKSRVFVVSIPDWGVTPFGLQSEKGQQVIAGDIDAFNAINKAESLAAGVHYIDITAVSRLALSNQALVASDGLHPSGKMYLEWAARVAQSVVKEVM